MPDGVPHVSNGTFRIATNATWVLKITAEARLAGRKTCSSAERGAATSCTPGAVPCGMGAASTEELTTPSYGMWHGAQTVGRPLDKGSHMACMANGQNSTCGE